MYRYDVNDAELYSNTVDFAILIEHLRRKLERRRSRSWSWSRGLLITSENTLSIITGRWTFTSWNYLAKGQLVYL